MGGWDALENFLRTNFSLVQHHKWAYGDLMEMIPWERQVYVALLLAFLKEENERLKQENMGRR